MVAHIPMDDIQQLWNDTPSHDWSSFHETLQRHKGKVDGISDRLIDLLLPVSEQMARSGRPFPESPQQLYEVLNQQIRAQV